MNIAVRTIGFSDSNIFQCHITGQRITARLNLVHLVDSIDVIRFILAQFHGDPTQMVNDLNEGTEVDLYIVINFHAKIVQNQQIQHFHAAKISCPAPAQVIGNVDPLHTADMIPVIGQLHIHITQKGSECKGLCLFIYRAKDHGIRQL